MIARMMVVFALCGCGSAAAPPGGKTEISIPTRTLPGGVQLPMLYMGSGNFTSWIKLVGKGAGIKTAWGYGDASQRGMLPQVKAAGFRREDVFLETMIPCGGIDGGVEPMNTSQAEWYVKRDLELLGTDYIDLLLLHHRCATAGETQAVWKVLEAALKRGDARAIGVSNFDASDLEELLPHTTAPIAANEGHFAVGLMDYETIDVCKKHNISLISFSSTAASVPTDHPTLARIAAKHNVSTYQVMYRFVSSHGISVLSAFSKLEEAIDDIGIFKLELDDTDMADIKALQTSKVTCPDCFTKECQACASLLVKQGCPVPMPAIGRKNPDSAKCMACAAQHNETIAEACSFKDMRSKACGTAGGFPKSDFLSEVVV